MNSTPKNPKDEAVRMDPTILLPDEDVPQVDQNSVQNNNFHADANPALRGAHKISATLVNRVWISVGKSTIFVLTASRLCNLYQRLRFFDTVALRKINADFAQGF
jgi:hypothetical protein